MAISVSYDCRSCGQPVRSEIAAGSPDVACPACGAVSSIPADEAQGGALQTCWICGCNELYVRKDFSQRLGVTIVVTGLLLSTVAWGFHYRYLSYAILFASALCDVVLYAMVGNALQCYRCQAEYRGLHGLEKFEPFDLETHERFRQQAIRMVT